MNYFKEIENEIIEKGFQIVSKDFERPWGGFLVIDESQAQDFANTFFDDIEKPVKILNEKDQIKLKQGERHRLIGLDDFAVVSEIWQHTDPNHPSDENDIVRISDDYGR